MEAKELMHGDYVMFNDKLCKFVIRSKDAILKRVCDGNEYPPCACAESNPIPLTEEILKANGFSLSGISRGTDTFDIQDFRLHKTDNEFWTIIGYRFPRLHYVHEVQRALRCCGLWELADNFKVNE